MSRIRRNLINQRFDRWIVIDYSSKKYYWKCKCDCGTIRDVLSVTLVNSTSRSCGCLIRETCTKIHFKGNETSGFNRIKGIYKRNARKRDLEFLLTDDELKTLFKGNCIYCGIEPHVRQYATNDKNRQKLKSYTASSFLYNGIDRADNTKGYIISNCVSCCANCNLAKMDYSPYEFYEWIDRIIKHNSNRYK